MNPAADEQNVAEQLRLHARLLEILADQMAYGGTDLDRLRELILEREDLEEQLGSDAEDWDPALDLHEVFLAGKREVDRLLESQQSAGDRWRRIDVDALEVARNLKPRTVRAANYSKYEAGSGKIDVRY